MSLNSTQGNDCMKSFRLFLRETPHADTTIRFDAKADDIQHAIEQAENAYPQCEVLSVNNTDVDPNIAGAILRASDVDEYEVHEQYKTGSFWLSVANASLWIRVGDDDLRVEVFGRGVEDADCSAEFAVVYDDLRPSDEVLDGCNEASRAAHKRFAPQEDF